MIIPSFWAESRIQHRQKGRQITLRRFGWSDINQEEAQAHADQRVKEALQQALSGAKVDPREFKRAYNGAIGVPIREEILSRHGDTIITRNAYGAQCLNSPKALFIDVDFNYKPPFPASFKHLVVLLICAIAIAGLCYSYFGLKFSHSAIIGLLALAAGQLLSNLVHGILSGRWNNPKTAAHQRISRFIEQNPEWNLRIYRTPAGLRLLATHRVFAPDDPAVTHCFDSLRADPLYVLMCRNQQCFRARVSPKPWRIGIQSHLKPRPGIWPIAPEHLPKRQNWVSHYENTASTYAACEFIENVGSGVTHPEIEAVVQLHDELCGALSKRPIA